jgi:hypothetical protein
MAITYNAQVAANWNKTSGTTLTANPTTAIPAGSFLIVECVADNTGTANQTSGSNEISFSDNAGNTYTKIREVLRGAGSANAGVTTALFWCLTSNALSTSNSFTTTLSASKTAKAFRVHRFNFDGGNIVLEAHNGAQEASTTPSVALSGLTSRSYLFFGTVGRERPTTDSETQDADYTNPNTLDYGTSGGVAATNVSMVSGYRIATLTGDTYNPTLGTSGDWGAILAAFYETTPNPPSSAPGNFQATAGDAAVALSWDAVSGATYYEVAIGESAAPTNWFSVGNVTSYTAGGLKNGTTYYVRVRAANSGGAGPATSDLSPTPSDTSGYQQVEADAGWRFPNRTLDQDNTQFNQAYGGIPNGFTRAVRGFYNNSGSYPEAYLSAGSNPGRRFRYRVRDGSSVSDQLVFYFRNPTKSYNSTAAWYVIWLTGGTLELTERINGTPNVRASGSVSRSANANYLVEILDDGSQITLNVDGSQILQYSSTSQNSNVNFGFSIYTTSNASIDWFSADIEGASTVNTSARGVATSIGRAASVRIASVQARSIAAAISRASASRIVLTQSRSIATLTARATSQTVQPVTARSAVAALARGTTQTLQPVAARSIAAAISQAQSSRIVPIQARSVSATLSRSTTVKIAPISSQSVAALLSRAVLADASISVSARSVLAALGRAPVQSIAPVAAQSVAAATGRGGPTETIQPASGRSVATATGNASYTRIAPVQAQSTATAAARASYTRIAPVEARAVAAALGRSTPVRIVPISSQSVAALLAQAVLGGAFVSVSARSVIAALGQASATLIAPVSAQSVLAATGRVQAVQIIQLASGQSVMALGARASTTRIAPVQARSIASTTGSSSYTLIAPVSASSISTTIARVRLAQGAIIGSWLSQSGAAGYGTGAQAAGYASQSGQQAYNTGEPVVGYDTASTSTIWHTGEQPEDEQ